MMVTFNGALLENSTVRFLWTGRSSRTSRAPAGGKKSVRNPTWSFARGRTTCQNDEVKRSLKREKVGAGVGFADLDPLYQQQAVGRGGKYCDVLGKR